MGSAFFDSLADCWFVDVLKNFPRPIVTGLAGDQELTIIGEFLTSDGVPLCREICKLGFTAKKLAAVIEGAVLYAYDICHLSLASQHMGRLRFELRTNRLKAECSTAELATRMPPFAGPMGP
jgi:hypothetical protein